MTRARQTFTILRLCIVAAQWALPGSAAAEPPRPLVVPMLPQGRPALPAELRATLHDAVARGLADSYDVVRPTDVRIRLYAAPDLLECADARCAARVAVVLHADAVVMTEVARVGKSYTIRVRSFGSDGRELGPPVEQPCEICTVHEADIATERAAAHAPIKRLPLSARR